MPGNSNISARDNIVKDKIRHINNSVEDLSEEMKENLGSNHQILNLLTRAHLLKREVPLLFY
jgi:hypothetical protein